MVQAVPVLHRAVPVVLWALCQRSRKVVLRVRSATSAPTPRSLLQQLDQTHNQTTLELAVSSAAAQETTAPEPQGRQIRTPTPSTTTLASNIKCRSGARPTRGRVWLLVGIEPASVPAQAAVPFQWTGNRSLTCRSRPTAEGIKHRAEAVSAFRVGVPSPPLVAGVPSAPLVAGVSAVRLGCCFPGTARRREGSSFLPAV